MIISLKKNFRNCLVGTAEECAETWSEWLANGVFGPGAGIGLRKTDPDLKVKIDEAIKAAMADGTIEELYVKYHHQYIPPI